MLQAALSGRDVLGIAKTGSGKTAAFLLPLVVHVEAQPRVRPGESPVALCLAPTRELAEQIHREARRWAHMCSCATQLPALGMPCYSAAVCHGTSISTFTAIRIDCRVHHSSPWFEARQHKLRPRVVLQLAVLPAIVSFRLVIQVKRLACST